MSEKVNRVGERSKANNGQWMEITEYFNNNNMTVKFEDGTVVKNKRYSSFKKGEITNPNYRKRPSRLINRIGEKRKANNGQWMEIIKYNGNNDLTIRFEDGNTVYNKSYNNFKKGLIKNIDPLLKNKIGETKIANNGQKMTIIEWFDNNNITIQFEDGTIVYNKIYANFKRGEIGNPNFKISINISVNEFAIYYYLRKYGFIKKEQGSLKKLGFGRMELDCYHPDYKIAIEYDGDWHETTINKDKRKNKICKQNGITIIRIREPKCPILNDNSIEYRVNSNKKLPSSFESALKEVFKYINSITKLNIDENVSFEQDKDVILKEFNKLYVNKYLNKRLGETLRANNGQMMTIIEYFDANNITVRFEDGTIVYNKTYGKFKIGRISNPNYNPHDKTGEINIATNGQKMTIIAYRGCEDIDIQFEDGTILKHKNYRLFKSGQIANPNYKIINPYIKKRIGETKIANNGQKMTIIAYHNASNIDIQFEDGTIVYHKEYKRFKIGNIGNPNFKKVA